MDFNKAALEMHETHHGKVGIVSKVEVKTRDDLSTAYTPGVAEPCRKIRENPDDVYKYTFKSNMVAVVSNGTAVLGLGDIGPEAGLPVMEGKAVLFKEFGGVDAFPICIDAHDAASVIAACKAIAPTFGGINLEDIKSPECFEIEETLERELDIPVFHDDQHGTAIISGAALLNSCEITGKKIDELKIVVVGAGAAGIACASFYVELGVKRENIFMFDSRGLIYKGRDHLNKWKEKFAQPTNCGDLAACMKGADMFLGLSKKGLVSKDMVRSMAHQPVIFAMANPDPEITYEDAKDARPEAIMGTGRSDYPNQINNVSGFPYIFRGALDVHATDINEAMKLAAAHALADLAKEPVPQEVLDAYNMDKAPEFGPDYVLPKPLDSRILTTVTPAVAKAAMESGVAQTPITDFKAYTEGLKKRMEAYHARVAPYVKQLADSMK